MKLQVTYKGQSAGQILKKATIETMKAGNVEVTVVVDNLPAHAHLGTRTDGWGGTHSDVLVIDAVDGLVARLLCGPRAVETLKRLMADVDRQQRASN